MLQRIQTVYLLLIICITLVLLLANIPLLEVSIEDKGTDFISFSQSTFGYFGNTILILTLGVLALISVITVFSFKNIPLQFKLTGFSFLLTLIFYISFFYALNQYEKLPLAITGVYFKWGIYVPAIIDILLILAFRGMQKDLRRIKSSRSIR